MCWTESTLCEGDLPAIMLEMA